MEPQQSSAVGAADAVAVPRQTLNIADAVALIIGIVVGAGIFSAPSLVAANAGSAGAIIAAWVVGGLISLTGAMCYAELATTYPHPGGDYHYLKRAFGDTVGFLFAWVRLTVIPTGSIALLAFVFGDYATQVVRLGELSSSIYAAGIVVMLTALNVMGLRQGKWTQNLLTLVEVAGILLIIVAGLMFVAPEVSRAETAPSSGGAWGLVLVFVMLTYGGWNEAAYISAELRGPRHYIARALFLSIGVITALYVLVNLAYLNVLGVAGMSQSQAVAADLMRSVGGERGAQIISALIAVSALTSANATILMGARTTYAFGRDFPLFSVLGRWNASASTPVNALLAQGTIALLLVYLGTLTRQGFATMVEYTAPVFWTFFLLTGIALFVLRAREPHVQRPFKVPLYPLTPIIFCATSSYLLYSSVMYTGIGALAGLAVLGAGFVVLLVNRMHTLASAANR
ncbi:MAG TPA: amino acid permease [Burkholderiales bacterium]|nr:amino acid permease [Burkholderiales bacterium]